MPSLRRCVVDKGRSKLTGAVIHSIPKHAHSPMAILYKSLRCTTTRTPIAIALILFQRPVCRCPSSGQRPLLVICLWTYGKVYAYDSADDHEEESNEPADTSCLVAVKVPMGAVVSIVRVGGFREIVTRGGMVAVAVSGGADHFVAHGDSEEGARMIEVCCVIVFVESDVVTMSSISSR
jgi:hypothetical protein